MQTLQLLLASTTGEEPTALVPPDLWTVQAAEGDAGARLRGAVVIRISGKSELAPNISPELASVVRSTEMSPGRQLFELLRAGGLWRMVPLLAGLLLAGLGSVVEALLFRGVFDVGQRLALFEQRLVAGVALLVLLVALSLVDWPVGRALWRVGQQVEIGLRRAFLRKLPRLGDRYFRSRPMSNMAESSHLLHWLRLLPGNGGQVVRCACELAATVIGVILLYPPSAPLVLALAGLMALLPLLAQPILVEKDLRMRGHAGGLARFYLDALLGLSAIRAHTAEGPVTGEHGTRLREWARAARDVVRTQVVLETLMGILGFGLAAFVVLHYLASAEGSGWAILLVYWVLMIPALGMDLAFLLAQYPQHRNITLRALEPLGAEEEASEQGTDTTASDNIIAGQAPRLELDDVRVEQGGNEVLRIERLDIAAGSHVAIVGVSGAGKSTLVGLLLGWYRQSTGSVLADGSPLSGRLRERLLRHTVWIDPSVQLWNRSILDNLRYGADTDRSQVGQAVEEAELDEVLARLPMGLQTPVGANGALLSGGEAQRVRLGRAFSRGRARLVILDEAFSGLERTRRSAMLSAARKRWNDATLLCITHDIGQTQSFGRVLVVEGGRIVEDGSPEELVARNDSRYRQLLAAETRALERLTGPQWRRLRIAGGLLADGGGQREQGTPEEARP
jgi:ABC-type transport system involved in cytochrome bd biosynthesis fused ATPase/permease subunit